MNAMTRQDVAAELRRMRRDPSGEITDRMEWVWCLVPLSMPVLRLRVRRLRASGRLEEADAAITQGLLWKPSDRWLSLARAERRLEENDPITAEREALAVLARRPLDERGLLIAGEAARRCGRLEEAVERLTLAEILSPQRTGARAALVKALCASGRAPEALAIVERWAEAPVLLVADVLLACGRPLDADDVIRKAAGACSRDEAEELFIRRLEILERLGQRSQLAAILSQRGDQSPRAQLRTGVSWLRLGAWRHAAIAAYRQRHVPGLRSKAMVLLAAAGALSGRRSLAQRSLRALKVCPEPVDAEWVRLVWSGGLLGRVVADQKEFSLAGRDPSQSVLKPLLERAVTTFERAIEAKGSSIAGVERWEQHRAVCLRWLGRERDGVTLHSARAA